MILKEPFKISARLLPAIEIGGAWVQLEFIGVSGGRCVYRWTIDLPDGTEHTGADLSSGVGSAENLQEMFGTLLSFLGACAESIQYSRRMRLTEPTENADLFPPAVGAWADQYSDEISSIQCWIEETKDLIEG